MSQRIHRVSDQLEFHPSGLTRSQFDELSEFANRHHYGERYSVDSYRRAIQRACTRAHVPSWSPNQLRHSAGTEIRKKFGLEASQVVLGHANAKVTEIYAERNMDLAREIMAKVG